MKKAPLLPILLLLVTSCAHKTTSVAGNGNADAPIDCNAVMCTMDFRTITLRVTNAQGAPLKLDRYQTITEKKAVVPTGDSEPMQAEGQYPVVTDAWMSGHRNTTTKMIFTGFLGNKEVVKETFEIKADCCHVSKVSGKESVVAR